MKTFNDLKRLFVDKHECKQRGPYALTWNLNCSSDEDGMVKIRSFYEKVGNKTIHDLSEL